MSVFGVDGPADVRIDIQAGRVDVVATARADVSVSVSPSNPRRPGDRSAAERVKVDRIGDRIVVTGPTRRIVLGSGDSVDVVAEVPEGSRVDVRVKYGPARLAGRLGAVRADVGYGDLTVDAADRLEITGGYGDIRVGRVEGALRLAGGDGRVVVDAVAGPADATTSSGAVELGSLDSGATVRSAYGEVRVRDAVRGLVRVDGSYGAVDIGVRRGTAVWLDAASRYGEVRTDLAADTPGEDEDTLELRLRTGYGPITVHHSDEPPRRNPR